MNFFIKSALTTMMAASTLFSVVAQATNTGTIHIQGVVSSAVCTIAPDFENQKIIMESMKPEFFSVVGATSDKKEFTIRLTKCDPNLRHADVKFTGDATGNYLVTKHESAKREDLAIALYESDGTTDIKINSTAKRIDLNSDTADIKYQFAYKSLKEKVEAKKADATLGFEITYY